jgi:DNA invertase Pin-like site-specific DNA recombinase
VLEFLHPGDVLMVTRIDRLARSIGDLQDIVRAARSKGASLKATEQPINTNAAPGKCFLDMLGVFAEFEGRDIMTEPSLMGTPPMNGACIRDH